MEKESYYFLFLLIALAICIGVFWFQFNNDVTPFLLINETEVVEGQSFKGLLLDSYGQGVANATIVYHKPGYMMGTIVDTQTDENGEFTIEHAEYLSDAGKDNYYGDFTYAGDDRHQGCTYDGNITVIPKNN